MSEPWVILTLRYGEDRRNQTAADLTEAVAQMYHETTPGMMEGDYEEHGSAWLRFGYDDGPMFVLTIKRHGEVTFEEFADQDFERELRPCRVMWNVPESHTLQLLTWLAHGDVERVRSQVWTVAQA